MMLTLVIWSLGLAFVPLALSLAWTLITGVGHWVGFGGPDLGDAVAGCERDRNLRSLNSDIISCSAALASRISPARGNSLSPSRH